MAKNALNGSAALCKLPNLQTKRKTTSVAKASGAVVLDQCIQEGVYIFLTEVGGNIIPYVRQSGEIAERIATHVRDGKIFGRLFSFIEVEGGLEARRIVDRREEILSQLWPDRFIPLLCKHTRPSTYRIFQELTTHCWFVEAAYE